MINTFTRGRPVALLLALMAMALLLLSACGDDDDADAGNDGEHRAEGDVVATAGDIEIINPYVRETVNDTAAVYMDLQSTGGEDRLVDVSADVGSDWQVHEVVEQDGSSSMRPVEAGLVIPAGDHLHFAPGGYHIMLLGLTEPLEPGDHIHVDLTFEQGGEVTIDVPVRAFDDSETEEDGH